MKSSFLFNLLIALCIASIAILNSCSENTTDPNEQLLGESYQIPNKLYGATVSGLRMPDGTTVERIDLSEVRFTFPKEVQLAVYDSLSNSVFYFPEQSYECSCSGTGCNVVYYDGDFGCSSCTATCTGKWIKGGPDAHSVPYMNIGFINLDAGISFVTSDQEFESLLPTPSFMFDIPEVKIEMRKFIEGIYHTSLVDESIFERFPERYTEVALNVFGTAFLMKIPNDVLEQNKALARYADEGGKKYECDCTSGNDGCTLEKKLIGAACIAGNCTTCRMTVN